MKSNQELAMKIRFTPLRGSHKPVRLVLSRASLRLLSALSEETGETVHDILENALRLYRNYPELREYNSLLNKLELPLE